MLRTRRNDSDDVASVASLAPLLARCRHCVLAENRALCPPYRLPANRTLRNEHKSRGALHIAPFAARRLRAGLFVCRCCGASACSVEPATRGAALLRQTRATRTLAHRTVRHAPLIACENCTVPPGAFAAPSLAAVCLFCGRRGQLLSDRVFSAVAKTQTRLRGRASAPARSRAAALVFS